MNFITVTEQHFAGISALVPTPEALFVIFPSATFPLDAPQLRALREKRKHLTVLLDGERVIAFANLYNVQANRLAFIGNLIVAPAYRGKGIGRALLTHMAALCRTQYNAQVHLSVFNTNTAALLLYSKFGFTPYALEQRSDLHQSPIALLHMKL